GNLRRWWRDLQHSLASTAEALPRVLRLVWEASPALTGGLFAATVVAGVSPAVSAYTSKLLVNAVVSCIVVRNTPNPPPDIVRLDFGLWHPAFSTVNAIIVLAVLQPPLFALLPLPRASRQLSPSL